MDNEVMSAQQFIDHVIDNLEDLIREQSEENNGDAILRTIYRVSQGIIGSTAKINGFTVRDDISTIDIININVCKEEE